MLLTFEFPKDSRFICHHKLHFAVVKMMFSSLFLRLLLLVVLIIWCNAFASALAQLWGEAPVRLQLPNSAKRFFFWVPFPFLRGGYSACPALQCAVCAWIMWLLTFKTTKWESFALLLPLTSGFTQMCVSNAHLGQSGTRNTVGHELRASQPGPQLCPQFSSWFF